MKDNDASPAMGGDLVRASAVGGELDVLAAQLVEQARAEGLALTGDGGLLPALLGRVLGEFDRSSRQRQCRPVETHHLTVLQPPLELAGPRIPGALHRFDHPLCSNA